MNRLKNEKSPYLLQHASNPVNWYAWQKDAFIEAKKQDKPLFISIGYSTCHWCHVMAEECFQDREVAQLLNDFFIPIKVDREERKDVDNVYMLVCQLMTGSGGWPLTIIATPDKIPFFAATYIPKQKLMELLIQINNLWKLNREKILKVSDEIMQLLKKVETPKIENKIEITENIFHFCYENLYNTFDLRNGGFGNAPKFPIMPYIKFLFEYYKKYKNEKSLSLGLKTLEAIRLGGIYDQIGGGVHRYSTDKEWKFPHFEKTLYDQALISEMYIDAYKITGKEFYRECFEDIFYYVKNRLMSENGGFYSGEDADIDFYLWDYKDLEGFENLFYVTPEGNFIDEKTGKPTGKNVLIMKNLESLKEFQKKRKILQNIRDKRKKPSIDKKILTDWNSLMSLSFIKAYKITKNREYIEIAEKNINFMLNLLVNKNIIHHRYIDNEVSIIGFIDDYIFFIDALLELSNVIDIKNYFIKAKELFNFVIKHFWDNRFGGFFYTPDFSEIILIRKKEIYDSVIPSANSRAFKIFDLFEKRNYCKKLIDFYSYYINSSPEFFTEFLANCLKYV